MKPTSIMYAFVIDTEQTHKAGQSHEPEMIRYRKNNTCLL